jgi:hypothetical protein
MDLTGWRAPHPPNLLFLVMRLFRRADRRGARRRTATGTPAATASSDSANSRYASRPSTWYGIPRHHLRGTRIVIKTTRRSQSHQIVRLLHRAIPYSAKKVSQNPVLNRHHQHQSATASHGHPADRARSMCFDISSRTGAESACASFSATTAPTPANSRAGERVVSPRISRSTWLANWRRPPHPATTAIPRQRHGTAHPIRKPAPAGR